VLFSVCTLVTDPAQHAAMQESFSARGFTPDRAEFLALDNSGGNHATAYDGLARLLDRARGTYAILCHQDVRLIADGAETLEQRLRALPAEWAVAGNAGMTREGRLVARISDPHGEDQARGPFPAEVASLDENFLAVRSASGLRPSRELSGFHLYGTDLCLRAREMGATAWVVDFHLRHLSAGRVDAGFLDLQDAFERHWGEKLGTSEEIRTTCTRLTLRGGIAGNLLGRWRLARRRARLRG
jgi:hypothetical protein